MEGGELLATFGECTNREQRVGIWSHGDFMEVTLGHSPYLIGLEDGLGPVCWTRRPVAS